MDQLALRVLNYLSSEYPNEVNLEACRKNVDMHDDDFRKVIAYLEEKAYITITDRREGLEGIYGRARIMAHGIDFLNIKGKSVRARFLR